jgi:hypothetical protein
LSKAGGEVCAFEMQISGLDQSGRKPSKREWRKGRS